MRGNDKSLKGIHLTVLERMHQFIRGRGRDAGAAQFVRGNSKSSKGINMTVLERMHEFIIPSVYVQTAREGWSIRGGGGGGWGGRKVFFQHHWVA